MAKRRHRIRWRLLALGGLLAGAAALFYREESADAARGRHSIPPSRESLECGHEVKDINVRNTTLILGAMAATTALMTGIVFIMIWQFNVQRRAQFAHLTPQQITRVIPPAPRLQLHPFAALARLQARESHLLHDYGWTSPDHSTARIPIDRAMALSVGKSLDAGP